MLENIKSIYWRYIVVNRRIYIKYNIIIFICFFVGGIVSNIGTMAGDGSIEFIENILVFCSLLIVFLIILGAIVSIADFIRRINQRARSKGMELSFFLTAEVHNEVDFSWLKRDDNLPKSM